MHSPFFDDVFVWISDKYSWIPFYVSLLVMVGVKQRWKALYVVLSIILLILMSDLSSVHLFKNVFERLRPCHNEKIASMVHIVNGHCGGKYGFVSSHATNMFALATFIGLLFKKQFKYMLGFMLLWAAIIAYSRVYLGVHYVFDIVCGGILGSVIGVFVYKLLRFSDKKFTLKMNFK